MFDMFKMLGGTASLLMETVMLRKKCHAKQIIV